MNTFLARIGPGVLIGLVALPVLAGDHRYTFYDILLPLCHSDPQTEATDVNDSGVVTGYFLTGDCSQIHGITWVNGVITDLDDTYSEGVFRGVEAISQTGVILGFGDPDEVLALRLSEALAFPLPVPSGCEEQGNDRGINDTGTMAVGQCDRNGQGDFAPAVYWIEDGTALALGLFDDLPADATGEARDVNDDGVVVGIVDGEQRSFMWQDGVLTEIINGLGGVGVVANAINNHGLIVGLAGTADGFPAMSYDMNTGVMSVLGSGAAHDVNDRGWASGDDIIDFSASHAVLYKDGEVIDLHELVLGDHLVTTYDRGINNYGWIVGWGDDVMGRTHGWLVVPEYDKGDYDGDGDVDLQDSGHFQRCFAADDFPDGRLHVGCSVFDFDDNNKLDLHDYAAFQSAFTGPTAPNNNPNGPG